MSNKLTKSNSSRFIVTNLPTLQNLCKRDAQNYIEEFQTQFTHYTSLYRLLLTTTAADALTNESELMSLLNFISALCDLYPQLTGDFPGEVRNLLVNNHNLSTDLKKTLVQCYILLKNKKIITAVELLQTLFPLLANTSASSSLRSYIQATILNTIKVANKKTSALKLNRAVQAMLYQFLDGETSNNVNQAIYAIGLVKECWKRVIWKDASAVNIITTACFHPNVKVQSAAIHFFLSSADEDPATDSEEEDIPNVKKYLHQRTINKTRRSNDKKVTKMAIKIKKKKKEKSILNNNQVNFSALELLHDPQTFGERLYNNISKFDKQHTLDHKVLTMQLLSQVMGAHKLCVLPFYSYIVKYLVHHQLRITLILVSLAQSVHELTPPDVLVPIIQKIAKEFVHPGVGSEVISAGINSITQICRRQPWAMDKDLLEDLIEYRKSHDKTVMIASRGLLQLYREVNPALLKKSERGKAATINGGSTKPLEYGHTKDAQDGIEGLELLEAHINANKNNQLEGGNTFDQEQADERAWQAWDLQSNSDAESNSDSESENGWVNVDSDGEADLVIEDSDEDAEVTPALGKRKRAMVDEGAEDAPPFTKEKVEQDGADQAEQDETVPDLNFSTLAQTKILTPADFALLNDLRIKALTEDADEGKITNAGKKRLASLSAAKKAINSANIVDDISKQFISEGEILGERKKVKQNYAERMADIKEGREGRDKFGSSKGKKNKEKPSSSTNRQKARNKPLMMAIHSSAVVSKKKASLRDKQMKLRAHVKTQKMKKK